MWGFQLPKSVPQVYIGRESRQAWNKLEWKECERGRAGRNANTGMARLGRCEKGSRRRRRHVSHCPVPSNQLCNKQAIYR